MIVNLYISEGKVIASHVDESTKHRRGDALSINDRRYILVDLVEFEHLDYLTIIHINYLVQLLIKMREHYFIMKLSN